MESPDPHDAEAVLGAVDDTHNAHDTQDTHDALDVPGGADDDLGSEGTAYDGVSDLDDQVSERDVPTAPTTGDAVVDAAMIELAAAEAGTLAERIDAGERAHRMLQGRLSDLGGA